MVLQFARQGAVRSPAGAELMRAFLANQGPAGSLGFLQAFRRPGRHERTIVNDLLSALSVGDELSTRRIVGPNAPAGADLDEITDRLHGAHPSKVLAAGRSITVSLTAGRSDARGVLIVDFADGPDDQQGCGSSADVTSARSGPAQSNTRRKRRSRRQPGSAAACRTAPGRES